MHTNRFRRITTFIAIVALFVLTAISPAAAHDPIFLTEDQTTPETGPYLPDGTISFALYGTLLEPDDTRGFEFDLREGEDLFLQILIPDLEPEISLAEADLPYIKLIEPSGDEREVRPDKREPFADPFSGTKYVTLYETVEPGAAGGRYQVIVTGDAPTRFTVAVGVSEEFFTPVQRSGDRPTSFAGIAEPLGVWYSTPAGAEPATSSEDSGVDVDVEMIEEELEAMAESDAADEVVEPVAEEQAPEAADDSETAAPADDSSDGSLGWVAPVAILAAAAGGGALVLMRRRTA